MDKKAKLITYIAIGVILILLIGIAVITKFSGSVPGVNVYTESGSTAEAIIGGYSWSGVLKSLNSDNTDVTEINYDNENIVLVKPGEKITLRNSGKDFDNYKFYQSYLKYYDADKNVTELNEDVVPVNQESKSLSFEAPQADGTYIYETNLIYSKNKNVQYSFKVVVSSLPSYTVESLIKYKNTYIGDATKVSQILNALPYKENRDGIILRTANKPYELIVYYKGLEVDKDSLFNNTVAIFALIENVDIVTYELDSKSIVYTRKELETVLGRDLTEYANNAELWKKEVFYNIKDYSNSNNLKIYKTVLDDVIKKINSDYIVIDLDSFGSIEISDVEKRELLKEFMKDGKIISEASNAEIRQRDSFKGILIYVETVSKGEHDYIIDIIKYDTERKQEKITYNVTEDGIIVK